MGVRLPNWLRRVVAPANLWWVIVGLPALFVFWASACFVLNHFLLGPYLHDSGWYSAIIHHQGLLPRNPPSVHYIREYFGIHVSLLVSLASLVSYLVPLDRVPYYCLFQGLIYAPLPLIAAGLLRRDPEATDTPRIWEAAVAALAGLAFATNGQVLACLGYPHYEIAVSVGVCAMLAGLATGRQRLAWFGLIWSAGAREDGGFHAAAFLVAVLMCDLTKRSFGVRRAQLVRMTVVAISASLLAFIIQKTFFHGANLFREEYLGTPAYAHLTGGVLSTRLSNVVEHARFILYPMAATVVVAAITRDPRYLFGWIVELPWFFLNLFAAQDLKSHFSIYTGFPFVGSIFWVGVYGRAHRSPVPTLRLSALLVLVSVASTLGFQKSHPAPFAMILKMAEKPLDIPYGPIAGFAKTLAINPDAYGSILVDPGIAAWAVERMPAERRLFDMRDAERPGNWDGISFFVNGLLGPPLIRFVLASPYTHCGQLPRTPVHFCTRPGKPLPPGFRLLDRVK